MKNNQLIVQALLSLLPIAERIALLFIHSPEATQKYSLVTGTVNEVAPIAAAIEQAVVGAAAAPASPVPAASAN